MMSEAKLYPRLVLRTGSTIITCMSFLSPQQAERRVTQEYLLTGTSEGQLLLWNLKTQTISQSIDDRGSCGPVPVLSVHADLWEAAGGSSYYIIAYHRDGVFRLYHWLTDNHRLQLISVYNRSLVCPTFCPSDCLLLGSELLIAGPDDKSVKFYRLDDRCSSDIQDCKLNVTVSSECGMVTSLKLLKSHDCKLLIVGSEAGHILLYTTKVTNMSKLSEDEAEYDWLFRSKFITEGEACPIVTLDYSHASNYGVSGAVGSCLISVWRLSSDYSIIHKHLSITSPSKGCNNVRLRADCKLVVCCFSDGTVRLYSPKRGTLLARLDFHRESVQCCVFNNTNNEFLTSSKDGMLCMWNLYSQNASD